MEGSFHRILLSICIYISVLSLCEAFQSHSRGRTAIHGLKPCALGPCSVVRTPLARLSMQGEEEIPLESVEDGIIGTYDRLWRELRGTCVFLVGMMGTGKSTSGDILARETGYRFIDTDEAVEFILEEPISSFLANPENEPQFRELEYKVLMEMAQYTRLVVATGGGVVLDNMNWSIMRHGVVVHLEMSAEDIFARLSSDPKQLESRPLLKAEDPLAKLEQIMQDRSDKYSQADVTVKIGAQEDPASVSLKVAEAILSFIEKNPPMWQQWREKRNAQGLEAAMRVNADATDEILGS